MGERDNELGCMHARCPTWISASWILLDTSQRGHCRPHATVWCLHCSAIEWFHCTIGALRAVVVLHKGIFLHEWVHVRRCPLFVQIIENLYRWFLKELCKKKIIQMSALFNVCLLVHACSRCLVIITQHWQPHHRSLPDFHENTVVLRWSVSCLADGQRHSESYYPSTLLTDKLHENTTDHDV